MCLVRVVSRPAPMPERPALQRPTMSRAAGQASECLPDAIAVAPGIGFEELRGLRRGLAEFDIAVRQRNHDPRGLDPVMGHVGCGHGAAEVIHVTGGGLVENPPRVYGDDLALRLDLKSWTPPAVFPWLAKTGGIEGREMLRTFNCGLGMLVMVKADAVEAVEAALAAHGETPVRVGRIEKRTGDAVVFDGLDQTWLA